MSEVEARPLKRAIGPLGAVMLVMGGIIGSGIFMNPAVVAKSLHAPGEILAAWIVGGVVALPLLARLYIRQKNLGAI